MSSQFIVFLSIFFVIYCAANYYVGLRLIQSFHGIIEPYAFLYWAGYVLIALSPFAARFGRTYFSGGLNDWITVIGDYWFAALYYFFFLWVVSDILRILSKIFFPAFAAIRYPSFGLGFGVIFIVGALLAYGAWNALNPRIHHYEIAIGKPVSGLPQLHAVLVSDIHLGPIVDSDRLEKMVNRINQLEPDVVFLAGDTIDEDVSRFVEQKMPEALSKLQTRLGVYAVLGNHEYLGGNSELAVEHLRQAGVKVLRDEYIKVNDQFYVVGRDDLMSGRVTGKNRLMLSKIMDGIDRSLPVVMLDHQPYHLEEGQLNGVDLQLSGHTHHGQFFPNNFFTTRMFENDWGYLKKGNYQVIVSCGFGTWGPPIRIGNYPEIVDILISFQQS